MSKLVTIALVGAGSRGLYSYAPYALKYPEVVKIVAVAEPREWYRKQAAELHQIPETAQFSSWQELLAAPQLADAIIIATPDREHTDPTLAALARGYHVLLEKPMATSEDECRKIVAAVREHQRILAVCHVMRYSPFFRKLKEVISGGVLGQIRTVRHIEQVGYWHHAHSYVRGNWRSAETSSPMILAKCCHDMDILLYLLEKRCVKASSFGSLKHFTKENRPAQATSRCLDCPLADNECPYSAKKFYFERFDRGDRGWPINVITSDISKDGIEAALRDGPYGRCVYDCDNDVVDSQIASLEFEDGIQVSFTMTAFTSETKRRIEIFGSHGEIRGSEDQIEIINFKDNSREVIVIDSSENSVEGGHLGGDFGIMRDFISALQNQDPSKITSSAETSLASHLMAFAAERSRLNNSVEIIR
jgi:predicted dehydrogenase